VSKLEVGAISDRGLSPKRPINEDRFLAMPEKGLFAVADGVGGELAGEVASQTVVDTLAESMSKFDFRGDIEDFLDFTLQRANQQIYEAARSNRQFSGMASTVALVCIRNNHATIAHIGDSRVYSLRKEKLRRETHDHTDTEDALRSGRMSEAEAKKFASNVINRAVGVEPEADPEFGHIDLNGIEVFLLCTDGITRHIPDDELEEVLNSEMTPQQMCEELKWRCHCRGAEDNLTALVIKFSKVDEEHSLPHPRQHKRSEQMFGKEERRSSSRIHVNVYNRDMEEETKMSRSGHLSFGDEAKKYKARSRSVLGSALKILVGAIIVAAAFYAGIYVAQNYLPVRQTVRWIDPAESGTGTKNYLREGSETEPDFKNALELFDNKEFLAARSRFQTLIDKAPNNGRYHYWFGRASFEAADYNTALKGFQKAASLNLNVSDVYLYEALSYQALGREKEAMQSFKRFAAERPKI
jgi:serine/threonine protein phosphatase PrpC